MSPWDWLVIGAYLCAVVAVGLWMGRRDKNIEDYFLGGRRIPWGAALLSMVATEISAATFLGAPEQGYTRDLTYLQFGIGSILARFVLAFLFIGVFYRLRLITVYGFLTSRFGVGTKNGAAAMFLLGRFFAGGSRLFIASLAVSIVTGLNPTYAIILLGTLAVIYTLFGGIKAVIWTDVAQAMVLMAGAILSIYFLWRDIGLPGAQVSAILRDNAKLQFFDTAWRDERGSLALFSNAFHFVPAILGGFFLTMATHGTDQAMIQRLLTCRDSFRGRLSMVLSGFLGMGITTMFMAVGLLLFVYGTTLGGDHPMALIAAELAENGQNGYFFLHYILHQLPPGLSGLLIAAVIAAAMSSMDSELNAMSATFVNDFYTPYFKRRETPAFYMRVARLATLGFGAVLIFIGALIADFYATNPDTDLLSIALGVMTFFYGGLLGIFLLGLLTRRRGSQKSTLLGLGLSTVLIIFIGYKGAILERLGLHSAEGGGSFFHWLYQSSLSWPWFIVLGTATAVAVAMTGKTAAHLYAGKPDARGRETPNG